MTATEHIRKAETCAELAADRQITYAVTQALATLALAHATIAQAMTADDAHHNRRRV